MIDEVEDTSEWELEKDLEANKVVLAWLFFLFSPLIQRSADPRV